MNPDDDARVPDQTMTVPIGAVEELLARAERAEAERDTALRRLSAMEEVVSAAREMRDSATADVGEYGPRCVDCLRFYASRHEDGCRVAAFDAALKTLGEKEGGR